MGSPRIHPLAPDSAYDGEAEDADEFGEDEMDEADINCHMDRDGQCGAAGSEYCEFECPYRDE